MDSERRGGQWATGAGSGAPVAPAVLHEYFRVGEAVTIVSGREAGRRGVVTYVDLTRRRRYRVKVSASLYAYCTEDEVMRAMAYLEPM